MGVVGAGQMGAGIAELAALSGIDVVLLDQDIEMAMRSCAGIERSLQRHVEGGRQDAGRAGEALARITPASEYSSLGAVDYVIEAVPEDEPLKKAVFGALDAATSPATILASNTSSISITTLAASTRRPESVIGMHFMNPVSRMELVEVIRGLRTADATCAATLTLAQQLGKTTVMSRDAPGFIVNRILIPMLNEACFALSEGVASADDIDRGIKLGLNHPMGPLQLADLIGLDTCLAIAEVLHSKLGDDKYRPSPLLRQYVAAGWLGRKAGQGFYSYAAP